MALRASKFLLAAVIVAAIVTISREWLDRALEKTSSASDYELASLVTGMNVVVIVLDTTPGKSLDLLDPTSAPLLSHYAREAVVFTKAYSAAPWTRPAIASILTGYHPKIHGVREFTSWYNRGIVTLGQILNLHGYETAGFVSHEILSQATTFKQGFNHYRLVPEGRDLFVSPAAPAVADAAIAFMRNHATAKKSGQFFLLTHFFDPHFNYMHHPDFDRSSWYKGALSSATSFTEIDSNYQRYSADDFSYLRDTHLEEVSFTELHVDRLLKALKASPYADNTIVFLMADHGEEFHEHGALWHGHSMYDEVLRVPLMVWAPKRLAPAVVNRWVSTMDVVPTLVNVKQPVSNEKFFGRPLFSKTEGSERWLYAEVGDNTGHPERNLDAVMREPYKFIVNRNEHWEGLFNLANDPAELSNLASNTSIAAPFRDELESSLKELAAFLPAAVQTASPLSAVQIQNLRSLGYLSEAKAPGDLAPAPE